ncbi:MAG TPA: uroporphyrinogen decarboxylase family protein [Methanomassiliicoccales archaeon]|nr:uroporphyrinogen decarboxylase family protein [Methanomassiliicoccales archaeon]
MDSMTHINRVLGALGDQPVDRLTTYPIACGVQRRLLSTPTTYAEWCSDPRKYAEAFIAGQKAMDYDFAIGLMDLSVCAADYGAGVRMDEQNTPFVVDPVVKSPEDYEKKFANIPNPKAGRSHVILEGTKIFVDAIGKEVITAGFLEGPLLILTQSAGAEKVFMDMYNHRSAVHKALADITKFDEVMVDGFAEAKPAGLVWDYLWGSYSCLGDKEYEEFEAQYARGLNKRTADKGMAFCIHNCADLPHLDTQVKAFKPAIYSMAWYPLIPGSPSAKETIAKGYADNCLMAGNIDPQAFVRYSTEKIEKTTINLRQEVKTALCAKGLHSRYCVASGCEVPPALATKLENIKAVVDTTKKYGQVTCT